MRCVRGGDLKDLGGDAPVSRESSPAGARAGTSPKKHLTWRALPLLVVVSLVAAACSGSAGQVGSTLAAMDGTVTLVKVISPAVPSGLSAQPGPGHKLVAVVLTVHSPPNATSKFGAIYLDSKLVDSGNQSHPGKGTAKYSVTSCAGYLSFSTLGAGQSQTGCEIFQLAAAVVPVELKIAGKASANWTIAASAIQPPAPGAAIGATPAPTAAPTSPSPQALGASPTTTGATATTGGGGAAGATPTGGTGTGAAPAPAAPSPSKAHKSHAPGTSRTAKILRVTPRGGFVGTTAQIWGKRLTGVMAVTFNGVPATIVKALPGRITVLVPPGATTGSVAVVTTSGTVTSPRTYVVL